jgi:hypothetical protein
MIVGALLVVSGLWRLMNGAPRCAWKGCKSRRTHEVSGFLEGDASNRDVGLCDGHTGAVIYHYASAVATHIATGVPLKLTTDEERVAVILRLVGDAPPDASGEMSR